MSAIFRGIYAVMVVILSVTPVFQVADSLNSFATPRASAQTASTTVNFDNPAPTGSSLNGIFQGINFGTGQWAWEGAYGANSTNHIYFANATGTSRTFTFSPAPQILQSVQVNAAVSGTVTLSDGVNPTVTYSLAANSLQTISTNWTLGSTTVTVAYTGGWELAVDNIIYRPVSGGTSDTTAPSIPANLSATPVSQTVIDLSWAASTDNVGVTGYEVYRCTGTTCTPTTLVGSPTALTFSNTGLTANTTYRYRIRARDAAGNFSGYSSVVNATTLQATDTTAPTASITAPTQGATVSNTVTVTVSASDNIGVAGVQLRLNGSAFGSEDTTSPYTFSWDTRTVANGNHTLVAVARDAAGNTGNSASVTVTVNNALATNNSISLVQNAPNNYDYGTQTALPANFGTGEFTMEFWVKPDNSYTVGPTEDGTPGQLSYWTSTDYQPYSSDSWWYKGNFLLDGHNNNNSNFEQGTFSLQFYGGGRVRWLFGDGQIAGAGKVRAVQAYPAETAPSLVDGNWHQVTLVRRWSGTTAATLELWTDGLLVASATSPVRTNMRTYWDNWTGFPSTERGWYWGAEKQAANNTLQQYEDYKGLVDEVRFWSRAKTAAEITSTYGNDVSGSESGLVGVYRFGESSGTTSCNVLNNSNCIQWNNMSALYRSAQNAPLGATTPVPPTAQLAANPTSITTGQSSMLTWSSTSTTSCTGTNFSTNNAVSGSVSVSPTATTTYSVSCTGTTGNASATVTVTVSAAPPQTPNLVAAYNFNEGTGSTLNDRSGTANNGAVSGATWTTSGRNSGALSFDGVNDRVNIPDSNSLDLTNAMTLEAWVYPTQYGSAFSGWRNVILKEQSNNLVYGMYANTDTSRPSAHIYVSGSERELRGTSQVPLNAWTHLAMTFDGTTERLYVNGSQVATRTVSGSITTSTGALRIGGNALWGDYFAGRIDDVRIYRSVRSASEITTDMNTPVN